MELADPNQSARIIRAYSKSQVMDWSLVLASQDISSTILRSDEAGWHLEVDPRDYQRAREAIRLYRLENRRWSWRQPIPWFQTTFHLGAAAWCAALILVHWLTTHRIPEFRMGGQFSSVAAWKGEWWRAFTAILLHADLAHLLANVTTGFVVLGLAMARYGAGLALLAAYLAGAAGNLAGLILYQKAYIGVGASGMVMGALGLISIPHSGLWSLRPRALKQVVQALFAGVFLFVLLGANPASDMVAHAGGYAAGAVLGIVLNLLPPFIPQSRSFVAGAWMTLGFLVLLTGWLALTVR